MNEAVKLPPAAIRLQMKMLELSLRPMSSVDEYDFGLKAEIANNPRKLAELIQQRNARQAKQLKAEINNTKLISDNQQNNTEISDSNLNDDSQYKPIDTPIHPDEERENIDANDGINDTNLTYSDKLRIAMESANIDSDFEADARKMAIQNSRERLEEIEGEGDQDNAGPLGNATADIVEIMGELGY